MSSISSNAYESDAPLNTWTMVNGGEMDANVKKMR